ncbi:DUF3540 domain-containing protein [Chitinimonas arctica]|uniref:DUF3540 domain-containing protein n=1 Tax=Chitinimonas arctica TaxID=2594795 RepID=A0A516SK24_9NEIS|nr:DUF3540 domain-containing protein [Chitinimonas arctica]QDQ28506.1 DUF3540 domain-containing protein [Chitinimonas arctica]
MMTATRPHRLPVAPILPILQEAGVALALGEGRLLLDDGGQARQALSCLVRTEPGDRVLWLAGRDGERYVLHVLARPSGSSLHIEPADGGDLTVAAVGLTLQASRQLSMTSLQDAELSAAGGRLTLAGRDVSLNVLESLLSSARNMVGRCENWLMTAKGLGRLHARQTMVTADEDIRADAERISLG